MLSKSVSVLFVTIALLTFNTHAATVRLDITGRLGDEVLGLHAGFQDAVITGYLEFDTDDRDNVGSGVFYDFTDWNILVQGNGVAHALIADNETLDAGRLSFNDSSDRITFNFDEDLNTPGGTGAGDRTLRFIFDQSFDFDSSITFEQLLATDPDYGAESHFNSASSLYQFGTSQAPMQVAAGEITGTVVPLPATAWLFSSGLLGLFGMARKKAA